MGPDMGMIATGLPCLVKVRLLRCLEPCPLAQFRGRSPAHHAQVPTTADIRAAITAEADRRGVTMRNEATSTAAPGMLPRGGLSAASMLFGGGGAGGGGGMAAIDINAMDSQLMGLIEALEGRLGLLRNGAAAAAAEAAGGVGGGAVRHAGDRDQGGFRRVLEDKALTQQKPCCAPLATTPTNDPFLTFRPLLPHPRGSCCRMLSRRSWTQASCSK